MSKKNNEKTVTEKKTKKNPLLFIGSVILLTLIAIAFIFTPGFGAPVNSNEIIEFGSYDGKKIIHDENFLNTVDYFMQQMEMYGQEPDFFTAMQNAFNDSVMTLAFTDEVEKTGYILPASKVERDMIQYFTDEEGNYSEMLFQQTDDATKSAIKAGTEKMAIRNVYAEDLGNVRISSKESAFIDSMNDTKRSFSLASFNTANYPQEEIEKFGVENAELFVQYNMQILTLNDEESAETLLTRINNQEITFTDAVTEFSIDQYSGDDGILNNRLQYELKNVVVDENDFNTLITLNVGDISKVIETSTGYSIFLVNANPDKAEFPNNSLVDAVYEYLTVFETGRIEEYFINKAKDFVSYAVAKGYGNALKEFELENSVVEGFPINYGNVPVLDSLPIASVAQLSEAQSNEKFFESVFSLEKGEYTDPIVLGDEVVVLLMNEEVTTTSESDSSFMYPYYISQFDSADVSSTIMASDKLENNLYTAIINNFL